MSAEEKLMDAIGEEEIEDIDDEPGTAMGDYTSRRHRRLQQKNLNSINGFLGKGRRWTGALIMPRYYGELLTWSLHRLLENEGWQVIKTFGYKGSEPVYTDVSTAPDTCENLLMNGQILIEKNPPVSALHRRVAVAAGNPPLRKADRFVVTIDLNPRWRSSVQVEGPLSKKETISDFIDSLKDICQKQNFYRGKKLEFTNRLRFLDLQNRTWDSIVLDAETKKDIKANTIEFQRKRERLLKYGIPPKRGILLTGEPGTGKTAICKALMAEAEGITCLAANASELAADGYINELYEIAQDLCPCLVFVEDIDQIGQDRAEFGYSSGSALPALLSILDGIEEKKEIITIATTNFLERLDKALSQRPSRFDRVIHLPRPSLEQRKELVSLLCRKIPLDETAQDYIALRTGHCTPAQLQEIAYSLVIEKEIEIEIETEMKFSLAEIDSAIRKIKERDQRRIGFCLSTTINGNGQSHNCP